MTQGRKLAEHLRKNFRIGPRTRRYRDGDLHEQMIEALSNATIYPGYYTGERHEVFTAAWGVFVSWNKHVSGYRIDPVVRRRIFELSPYRFAELLGQMLDDGVTNAAQGEEFFRKMSYSA